MKYAITIMLIFFSALLSAQDSGTVNKNWELKGYIKNLESITFDKNFKQNISGNLLHNRFNVKWKPTNKWTAVIELRNRLFWGEEIKLTPGYAELLRNDNEKVNMQKAWINQSSLVLHTNVERLYADFREPNLNIRVGRQRVNWGVTTTWNPMIFLMCIIF